jgi:hypothetical protein
MGELENPPLYYSFYELLEKINNIQEVLISYSEILLFLSSGEDEGLKKEIKEIESSINSLELTDNMIIHISSFTIFEGINILTKEKREILLKKIINNNQSNIQIISNYILDIIEQLEFSLYFSYDKLFFDLYLHQSFENNKKAILLTKEYEKQKENLKKLKEFYFSLPNIHSSLLEKEDDFKFLLKDYNFYS